MKEIKYLFPLKDSSVIDPQRSMWTNPSCSFVRYSIVLGMRSSDASQAHIPHNFFFINFILGSTRTIPFLTNSVSPPKCKWPNWKCNIIALSPCSIYCSWDWVHSTHIWFLQLGYSSASTRLYLNLLSLLECISCNIRSDIMNLHKIKWQ